jgi:hypothetical protein
MLFVLVLLAQQNKQILVLVTGLVVTYPLSVLTLDFVFFLTPI